MDCLFHYYWLTLSSSWYHQQQQQDRENIFIIIITFIWLLFSVLFFQTKRTHTHTHRDREKEYSGETYLELRNFACYNRCVCLFKLIWLNKCWNSKKKWLCKILYDDDETHFSWINFEPDFFCFVLNCFNLVSKQNSIFSY